MHLRNTLAKGMDAESYSLHTFEALLSQSMENLGNTENLKFSKHSKSQTCLQSLPKACLVLINEAHILPGRVRTHYQLPIKNY